MASSRSNAINQVASKMIRRMGRQNRWSPVIGGLVLSWLWLVVVSDLAVEWTVNPQYSFGWAVPGLCAFLFIRILRVEGSSSSICDFPVRWANGLICLGALFYLPTRLIQQANPGWRLVSWGLAMEVIAVTLGGLGLFFRDRCYTVRGLCLHWKAFLFPLGFFLVAVPWPTFLEGPLIQALTRADVAATCELANWFSIPAMPHGNVIEVATGQVGIDEACSGIRSFQATLMISLFLGEYYRLTLLRRLFCIAAGFVLALLFNLGRLAVLVWVAAGKGISAIERWHDPTGVVILLGCFCSLWFLGKWLQRGNALIANPSKTQGEGILPVPVFPLATLAAWIVLTEIGVEGWYQLHASRLPAPLAWKVVWPTNNATFKAITLPPAARQILRFDDSQNGAWSEAGQVWQAVFLKWKPGRAAMRLAQNHTPEICLTAAGHKLAEAIHTETITVRGLQLPFQFYELTDMPRPVFVAYCLWQDRASDQSFSTLKLNWKLRLVSVLAGQRNLGQRSLEITVAGVNDFAAARAALQTQLEQIINREP